MWQTKQTQRNLWDIPCLAFYCLLRQNDLTTNLRSFPYNCLIMKLKIVFISVIIINDTFRKPRGRKVYKLFRQQEDLVDSLDDDLIVTETSSRGINEKLDFDPRFKTAKLFMYFEIYTYIQIYVLELFMFFFKCLKF